MESHRTPNWIGLGAVFGGGEFGGEVGDGFCQAVFEGDFGFPAEEFAGAGDVGLALFGVVLGKGFEDDFAFATDD